MPRGNILKHSLKAWAMLFFIYKWIVLHALFEQALFEHALFKHCFKERASAILSSQFFLSTP
tara:strand:- start:5 stop:190 length:186 start_codon:yes stop_codon:yes gene_type:complete